MSSPLISVIVPVYNVESYLRESIDSVIGQSLGFRSNIEIIIVDDGSTDGTSDICQSYLNLYPDNIKYIYKKNSGVSSARNAGLKLSSGNYIHFLDGDDVISKNFYSKAIKFLKENSDIDFVAIKLKFFDSIIDSHPLNYKFSSDTVIDLSDDPDSPILHVVSCVFKRESVEGRSFDERLTISEDLKFISDVLLERQRYGVISSPVYYYRKRLSEGSAISGKEKNKGYYLRTPKYVYEHILNTWSGQGGIESIERTILYDVSYRLKQSVQGVLSSSELDEYKKSILTIASRCSDASIVSSRHLTVHQKIFLLKYKYKENFSEKVSLAGGLIKFNNTPLYDYRQARFHVDFIDVGQTSETLDIEGYIDAPMDIPGISCVVRVGSDIFTTTREPREQREESFLGSVYYDGGAVSCNTPVVNNATVSVEIVAGEDRFSSKVTTGPFTGLGALRLSYRIDNGLLLHRSGLGLKLLEYSRSRHLVLELRMLLQIVINWRLRTARDQLAKLASRNIKQLSPKAKLFEVSKPLLVIIESLIMIPQALILRVGYFIAKRYQKKPIWIVSDRGMAAGDNGEAIFRYIVNQPDCPADVYFVISKKSKDYGRMGDIGPVLAQESLKYRLKFLLSEKIISSQADIETTNPFIRQVDQYVNLFNFDFIFLQHGIIRHNLSGWLNKYNKNISKFITSAKKEYDSIFSNPYYYDKESVLLSGLPRYDYLESRPLGKVILAPTYRKSLAKQKTDKNGMRKYDPDFKYSEYRNFYNNLMNDDRIKNALSEADMTGELYLHPALSAQHRDFDSNHLFSVMDFPYDYRSAFREGNLLISDHSSVVFDFAYLKKPVVYAHFDVDTFFDSHSYDKSNFFSDEEDGFGEVYYDYDSLVEGVVKIIKDGCIMSDEYRARVDRFFYRLDKNNSKRVYEALLRGR